MAWFKVDDGFWSHPKVLELSPDAVALWVRAGSYSAAHLTDGLVKSSTIRMLGANCDIADELVSAGLWAECEDGWVFHDWSAYQPSRDQVLHEREKARERMRNVRANTTRTFGSSSPSPSRPVPSRPDPVTSNEVTVPPPTPSEPRNVRLPKDWEPTKEHQERALNAGIDLNVELEKFKAHAGENDRHAKNWNLAFTRWLINAGEYAKRDKARGGRLTYAERQEAHWQAELANAKAFEAKQNQTTLGALGK